MIVLLVIGIVLSSLYTETRSSVLSTGASVFILRNIVAEIANNPRRRSITEPETLGEPLFFIPGLRLVLADHADQRTAGAKIFTLIAGRGISRRSKA
jgi:hypothetical protein